MTALTSPFVVSLSNHGAAPFDTLRANGKWVTMTYESKHLSP